MESCKSRTWLVAVMKGDACLCAENLVGSRNYIPRLLEICSILVDELPDLSDCEVIMVRDNWRGDLHKDEIRKFAEAYKKTA